MVTEFKLKENDTGRFDRAVAVSGEHTVVRASRLRIPSGTFRD
jgi:hypothetical protein